MSNTPDTNPTTAPPQPKNPLDPSKVAEENQAIASALRKAQLDNQELTSRYTNNAVQLQCEFAEIFSTIPKTLEHQEMLAGRLPEYIKIDHPNFFASRQNDKERSENAGARELLGYNSRDKSYALLPPLLYLLFRPEDPNGLFRSEELMKLAKVLLFCSQSIKPTPGKTKKTLGQLWDV
ncbi:hypothetical protein PQX77_020442, partial [Marasmius sp. AFHP31]